MEKLTPEAGEITASVKDLPGLKCVSSVKYYQDFTDLKSCSSCSVTCLLMLLISEVFFPPPSDCRTPLGRGRAWLRLALMQKKLSDYMKTIINRKDLLRCV